jgi:hypothetical protein
MSEIAAARVLFLLFFGLIIVLVFLLPREYIFRGAPDRSRWRDLRYWTLGLVLIHAYVYWAL